MTSVLEFVVSCLSAPASADWAAVGADHIERHGTAWMICNKSGRNIAHTSNGAVVFDTIEDAEIVMKRLKNV